MLQYNGLHHTACNVKSSLVGHCHDHTSRALFAMREVWGSNPGTGIFEFLIFWFFFFLSLFSSFRKQGPNSLWNGQCTIHAKRRRKRSLPLQFNTLYCIHSTLYPLPHGIKNGVSCLNQLKKKRKMWTLKSFIVLYVFNIKNVLSMWKNEIWMKNKHSQFFNQSINRAKFLLTWSVFRRFLGVGQNSWFSHSSLCLDRR